MPLRVIKGALEEDPERVHALIELEDRILERALASAEDAQRVSRSAVARALRRPAQRARAARGDRRADAQPRGYDRDDVKIIEAIASFRAGGYEEALGFTVYDTLRYREALEPLVRGGGARAARPARRRGRGRARDGDRRRRRRAAARADRRDALQAAARRAGATAGGRRRSGVGRLAAERGARYQRARWCSTTPQPVRQRDASRQRARERPERRAVVAACTISRLSRRARSASAVKRSSRAVGAARSCDRSSANVDRRRLARLAVDPHRALGAASAGR